jgi:hypothetical protein
MIDAVCFKCKVNFALTNEEYNYLEVSGANFYCPICGQVQHYVKGNPERLRAAYLQKLRQYEYLQARKRELDRSNDHLRAQVRGLRGYITRLKNEGSGR